MRRSDQRRAAVFALYQHDLTRRPLDDVFERDAGTFTRALARPRSVLRGQQKRMRREESAWTISGSIT